MSVITAAASDANNLKVITQLDAANVLVLKQDIKPKYAVI